MTTSVVKEFRRIGAGLGGGSGWMSLGLNLHTGSLKNCWHWDHQYAAAPAYRDAFLRNIKWETVAVRLEKALGLLAVARQIS